MMYVGKGIVLIMHHVIFGYCAKNDIELLSNLKLLVGCQGLLCMIWCACM